MITKRAANYSAITAILLLQSACPPWRTSPPLERREHFLVAFVRDGLNDVAVTWSENGQTWNNGRFPATPTSTAAPARASVPFNGAAASADTTGLLHDVLFDQPGGYADVAGLGPATWDATGAKYNLSTSVLSGPATIDLGGRNRLVAVRQTGDSLGVYSISANGRTITPIGVPGSGLVEGRPALVRRNDGEVLLAWRERGSLNIVTATGRSSVIGGFTFTGSHQLFTAESAPAIAADGRFFYLSVVERSANSWRTQIYQSPDGIQWNAFATSPASPNAKTLLGLAALSNGTLLEASLTDNNRYRTAAVYLCPRTGVMQPCSRWSQINQADVFKAGASFKEFAVIRAGLP